MSSIRSILSTAVSALRASQAGSNVVSNNVANASTEGYTRRRAELVEGPARRLPEGTYGSGVAVRDVSRLRDTLLDATYRAELGRAEGFDARAGHLSRIEALAGEPEDQAVSVALDAFIQSWSELASNPESATARTVVHQRATELTFRMNALADDTERLRAEAETTVKNELERANDLVDHVADLNGRIVGAEADGRTAADLRDIRDRTLDELGGYVEIRVHERSDGSVTVSTGGTNVVDGGFSVRLVGRTVDGRPGVGVEGAAGLVPTGGSLGGSLDFLAEDVVGFMDELDRMADAVVTAVNDLHRQGTNEFGEEGVDFFHRPVDGAGDPLPVTASTFRVSDRITETARAIAAGSGSDPGGPDNEYLSGQNDVALGIAGLHDEPVADLGVTLGEHWRGVVGEIAMGIRSLEDSAEVHRALEEQAEVRRISLSGVSTDEEMVKLLEYQTGYAAAARVVTVADEMLQTLLSI